MVAVQDVSVELSAKVGRFLTGMKKSTEAISALSHQMSSISRATAKMTAALTAVGAGATVMSAKFEQQMTRTAAVAAGGAAGFDKAFSSMSSKALDMAGATQFTARQVGEAMQFMAMAGMDTTKVMENIPGVLQLAAASGADLGSSADIVTNIMASMGIASKDLTDANNILIGTFTSANVSLSELGQSFKMVGPVAKSLGMRTEEVAAAFGMMGNSGIKGTEAGTGLRRMLVGLVGTAKKSKEGMADLGVSIDDISGPGGSFANLIKKLEEAQQRLGSTKFQQKLIDVFGQLALPKIQALVEQGSAAYENLGSKISKARKENIAFFLEQKQLETLAGKYAILESSIEKLAISFGDILSPKVKGFVDSATSAVNAISNLDGETKTTIANFGIAATSLLGVTSVISGLAAAFGFLVTNMRTARGAMVSLMGPTKILGGLGLSLAGIYGYKLGSALVDTDKNLSNTKTSVQRLNEAFSFATSDAFGFNQTISNLGFTVLGVSNTLLDLNYILNKLGLTDTKVTIGEIISDLQGSQADRDFLERNFQEANIAAMKLVDRQDQLLRQIDEMKKKYPGLIVSTGKLLKGRLGSRGMQELRVDTQKAGAFSEEDVNAVVQVLGEFQDLVNAEEGLLKAATNERKRIANERARIRKEQQKEISKDVKSTIDQLKKSLQEMNKAAQDAPEPTDDQKKTREKVDQILDTINDQFLKSESALTTMDAPKSIRSLVSSLEQMRMGIDEVSKEFWKLEGVSEADQEKFVQDLSDLETAMQRLKRAQAVELLTTMASSGKMKEFQSSLDAVNEQLEKYEIAPIKADEVKIEAKKIEDPTKQLRKDWKSFFMSLLPQTTGTFKMIGKTIATMLGDSTGKIGETIGEIVEVVLTGGVKLMRGILEIGGKAIRKAFDFLPSWFDSRFKNAFGGMESSAIAGVGLAAAFYSLAQIANVVTLQIQNLPLVIASAAVAAFSTVGGIFAGLIAFGAQGFSSESFMDEKGNIVQAPERDAFTRFTDSLKQTGDMIVGAMQPFLQQLFPLAGLFHLVIRMLVPFADALGRNTSVASVLFNMFKHLGIVLGETLLGIVRIFNFFNRTLNNIITNGFGRWFMRSVYDLFVLPMTIMADTIAKVIQAFGLLITFIGTMLQKPELLNLGVSATTAAQNIQNSFSDMGSTAMDMTEAMSEITINENDLVGALTDLRNATSDSALDIFNSMEGASGAANGFQESLTNVPSGFKVSLERWRSIMAGDFPTGGTPTSSESLGQQFSFSSGGVAVSSAVMNMSAQDYFLKMYDVIRAGVLSAIETAYSMDSTTYSSGYQERRIQGDSFGSPTADANIHVNIDNLYAADGEDFKRKIVSAVNSTNYKRTGSQFSAYSSGGPWRS